MVRTVYYFDDLKRKVPVGHYDDGFMPVGGRIFYIDSNSDETVKFYDSQFQEISNVAVGDTPMYYKVTSAGVSGKEKYYVYYPEVYTSLYWTYMDSNYNYKYEETGITGSDIGEGKTSTSLIMSIDNGAYISDFNNRKTIWKKIQEVRDAAIGGCSDWYLPSSSEFFELKSIVPDDFNLSRQWSFEFNSEQARQWNTNYNSWRGTSKGTTGNITIIRSF